MYTVIYLPLIKHFLFGICQGVIQFHNYKFHFNMYKKPDQHTLLNEAQVYRMLDVRLAQTICHIQIIYV